MIKSFLNIKIKTLFASIAIFSITTIAMIAQSTLELHNDSTVLNRLHQQQSLNQADSPIASLEYHTKIQKHFNRIYTLLGIMVLAFFFIIYIIRQKVLLPTEYLLQVIQGFIKGETPSQTKEFYNDEIGQMSKAFFKLKDTLDSDIQRIRELAEKDSLTGIYNRRTFFHEAQNSIESVQELDNPCSLMILDIDYFKNINDTYGHITGDKILSHVVHHIRDELSQSDIFARYGGEEFIVLMPNRDIQSAYTLAQNINQKIAKTPYIGSNELLNIKVTLSIGVTLCRHNDEIEAMIKVADEALYKAKNSGRNKVVVL
ncbi:MAG: diguanylate cyclase [Campylobacterales bacterium]|nr:diguanylate cyclase [Campylobacterales bacterium]